MLIATFVVIFSSPEHELCKQEFIKIWPGDLVFDPTWPKFDLGLEFAKTNILIKFHLNRVSSVNNSVVSGCPSSVVRQHLMFTLERPHL